MPDSPAPPDNRTDRLGTERVGKLLLEFSVPAIVSMVFNTLYNVEIGRASSRERV